MKLVIISDVHNRMNKMPLPDGDVLVVCGDLTSMGHVSEVLAFKKAVLKTSFPDIVVIAGNHDLTFDRDPDSVKPLLVHPRIHYLEDSGVEIGGLKFWGSPYTPTFGRWAFMKSDAKLKDHWDLIPDNTDVLITHGPPYGILDETSRGDSAGSVTLLEAVKRVRPRLHCFGHIHEAYGTTTKDGTTFVNAATCTLQYIPSNEPVVMELK